MLNVNPILSRDGVEVSNVCCRHEPGRGHTEECADVTGFVLVRRGCFIRMVDGVETVLDPTTAYFMRPGEQQRFDHPHPGGDDCTSVVLDESLVDSVFGQDFAFPTGALPVQSLVDLEHRLLLASATAGTDADPDQIVEWAIDLVATAGELADPGGSRKSPRAGDRTRRALAGSIREILAADPDRSLPGLSRDLAASPQHLSRTFRRVTGTTISGHRMRLRVRAAMERLAGGEGDLARLAADTGFADQSHLCRVVRRMTGETPSSLRSALTK